MEPLVSVIVPCYNAEKTLEKTLDSLVNQTLSSLEILVIDDGSTDGSSAIMTRFANQYPFVKVFHKPNGGIADARNFGLDHVTGKYFGFLDSDDTCVPTMFEELVQVAEKEQAQVTVAQFNWIYPDHQTVEVEGPYGCGKEMLVRLFAVLWNKLYLTSFIRQTRLRFPTGNRYEDACFLYCLTPWVTSLAFVPKPMVNYVQQPSSITHTSNQDVKNMVTVFKIITQYYETQGWTSTYKDELEYLHIRFFLGNSFLKSCHIPDPQDRKQTILLGWNLLNSEFPRWKMNPYLKEPGWKNRYFRLVSSHNLGFFSWFFRTFKKL